MSYRDCVPRSRSDVPRRLRQSAAAADLRLPRQRAQDVEVPDRQGGADRQGDEAARRSSQLARGPLLDRAVPDDAQHRRRRHGHRSAKRASSTATCSRGTCPTCSSWARACSRKTPATTRPAQSARSPTGPRTRSATQYLKKPGPAGVRHERTTDRRTLGCRCACVVAGGFARRCADALRARKASHARDRARPLSRRRPATARPAIPTRAASRSRAGSPVPTPFGTIYSTNITPDRRDRHRQVDDGRFLRAMHDGIAPGGKHLYPAFPVSVVHEADARQDVDAIKAYLDTLAAGAAGEQADRACRGRSACAK